MFNKSLKILNFNAYRAFDIKKIMRFNDMLKIYHPSIVTIQEIHVQNALRVFQGEYKVIVNIEQSSREQIGICMLIQKNIKVKDIIIGQNGRIIGVLLDSIRVFNLYPKSGTQNRNQREIFFREELPHLLKFWDNTKTEAIFCGDYNCIHRREDSLNYPDAHLQPALNKFMISYGLKDDFLRVNGNVINVFSRITLRSKTRIDFILSDTEKCTKFEYVSYPFLDHKVIVSEYSIQLSSNQQRIPRDRFISGWVIGRELEQDEVFLGVMQEVLDQIDYEVGLSPDQFSSSFIWFKFKETLISWAKRRSRYLKKEKNIEYERMLQFYDMAIEDLCNGYNCQEEIKSIIIELNNFYNTNIKDKIRNAKYLEIKDNVYDLVKKQKEAKFKNGSNIEKVKIDGVVYEGNVEMVDSIEKKMKTELKSFKLNKLSLPDGEERKFLDLLPKLDLIQSEIEELENDINEDEVAKILELDVDLDSSPGYDGLTYRFIKLFWGNKIFRRIYVDFLNGIKNTGDFGPIENIGVMVLKNKKGNSIEYSKKRKLTKMNKDVNLLGKIWTERCKNIILDKIVPKSQFVCQTDQNIVDELRRIRDINLFLLEKGKNGSILSLDYADAFRSVSLQWFKHVMDTIGFPTSFSGWYWHMVKDMGIVISVNRCKSSVIKNERGFPEGFPPSMCCWVIAQMALIIGLEQKLTGIELKDGRIIKDLNFADDQKLFLREPEEIHKVEEIVTKFEQVSGVKLHRNKLLKKCNILCFGQHRGYQKWPDFVNVVDSLKVIGATFINDGHLEMINSEHVKVRVIAKINENWGIRGTLCQKAFFCNTFCLSKLNYLGQVFKLDKKCLDAIKAKALAFIYAGYNERPVQVVNFREKSNGGLGLHHPELKAKSLLLKNMYREVIERDLKCDGRGFSDRIYGYEDLLVELIGKKIEMTSKEIYTYSLRKLVYVNNITLIPSRIEKKIQGVKWTKSFRNIRNFRGSPKEKEFIWMLIQDILPVNGRLHRKNSDKRCLRLVNLTINPIKCLEIQDRIHFFINCVVVKETFESLLKILERFLRKQVTEMEILHLSFGTANKKITKMGVWLVGKFLYKMYFYNMFKVKPILESIRLEISFYETHFDGYARGEEFKSLKTILNDEIRVCN